MPGQEQSYAPPEGAAELVNAMDAEYMDEPAALSLFVEYANTYHQTTKNDPYGGYSVLHRR